MRDREYAIRCTILAGHIFHPLTGKQRCCFIRVTAASGDLVEDHHHPSGYVLDPGQRLGGGFEVHDGRPHRDKHEVCDYGRFPRRYVRTGTRRRIQLHHVGTGAGDFVRASSRRRPGGAANTTGTGADRRCRHRTAVC